MSDTIVSIETMAISNIQPMTVFCLVTTVCESGGTLDVVVKLKDVFIPPIVPHLISKANHTMKVSKVQPKSWHAVVAKLHDLLMWPTIDRAIVIPSVVVLHKEEGIFKLKGASTCQYWPNKVLDFDVGPFMLNKDVVDGLGLTDLILTYAHIKF